MHVDTRLEQFTALIEQQRARQANFSRTTSAPSLTNTQRFSTRLGTVQPVRMDYEQSAARARQAMASRNPALAAKLERAQLMRGSGNVQRSESVSRSQSATTFGQVGTTTSAMPITADLLAVPKRQTTAPGLGMSIDTYA